MNQKVILSVIRHILTFVGGMLIAKGVVSESLASEITGFIVTAVGSVWSIVEKWNSEKK
jgi:hypothetical protein